MSRTSELEKYLRSQQNEGHKDSEGAFSIAREQAIRKLAGFQLPFDGAWALKIVQAAVASGVCQEIKVTLTRTEQSFELIGVRNWTLNQLEAALFNPDSDPSRAVNHLVTGLRGVGFSDLRGFWIGLPGESEALTWNGDELGRLPMARRMEHPLLIVTCKARFEDGGFFGLSSYATARERNATLGKVLSTMAYTCPVPLHLDRRRIDALELDQIHGWSKTSQLLALGFEDGDLPSLKIPRQTGKIELWDHPVDTTMKEVTREFRERPPARTECAVAFLVSAHLERVQQGKTAVWKEREDCSHCNWVADGVVVQTQTLGPEASFCSAGWFLSADGLETDLTTLSLRDTPERNRRFQLSRQLVGEGLQNLTAMDPSKISELERKSTVKGAVVFLVLGAGLTFLSPVHGVACMGMGAFGLYASTNAGKQRERLLRDGLGVLQGKFDGRI
ncbi:MAG: hypothetical protein KC800_08675 [Candidatus Eremiobacteraeota bacterium]|nr:hypothetical protein [Candidatus Eremiobacteraeota bacterium]